MSDDDIVRITANILNEGDEETHPASDDENAACNALAEALMKSCLLAAQDGLDIGFVVSTLSLVTSDYARLNACCEQHAREELDRLTERWFSEPLEKHFAEVVDTEGNVVGGGTTH